MAANQDLRIGDAEREAAAASLREHYAEGRLSLEEFNQRLDAAFGAATQGQLDQVTRDLPHVRTPSMPLPGTGGQRSAGPQGSGTGAGLLGGGLRGGWGRGGWGRGRYGGPGGIVRGITGLAVVAVLLLVVTPLWRIGWFGLGGRLPIVVIIMVIARILLRLLFGRRMRRGRRW